MSIEFLDLEIALMVHRKQIAGFGGSEGIRDLGLLESALAQAEQSFGGQYLHKTIWEMAAAYAYHICQNHPFEDGNKRTALNCAMTFLGLNGYHIYKLDLRLEPMMMKVARGEMDKETVAATFEEIYRNHRSPKS